MPSGAFRFSQRRSPTVRRACAEKIGANESKRIPTTRARRGNGVDFIGSSQTDRGRDSIARLTVRNSIGGLDENRWEIFAESLECGQRGRAALSPARRVCQRE